MRLGTRDAICTDLKYGDDRGTDGISELGGNGTLRSTASRQKVSGRDSMSHIRKQISIIAALAAMPLIPLIALVLLVLFAAFFSSLSLVMK